MNRLKAAVASTVVAGAVLVGPVVSAEAKTKTYQGAAARAPGSTISFDLVTKGEKRIVKNFFVDGLPCLSGGDGQTHTGSGGPLPRVKVNRKGKFSTSVQMDVGNGRYKFVDYRGTIPDKGAAKGIVTVYDESQGGEDDPCDSGDLPWRAKAG